MLINIQLLRFIAAFSIVIFHAVPLYQAETATQAGALFQLFGFAGVDVFFVISGFIMQYTTRRKRGGIPATVFIRRRFARVYTGYWPYLLFALLLYAFYAPDLFQQKEILPSLFLLPASLQTRVIPVAWTLSFELYFYFLFSLFLLLPETRRLKLFLLFVGALILVNWAGSAHFDFYGRENFAAAPHLLRLLVSPFTIEFFAGCILCEYVATEKRGYPLTGLSISLALIAAGAWYNHSLLNGELALGYHVRERVLFYGVAAIFAVYAFVAAEQRGVVPFDRFSRLLGGASYSIYLSHTLFFAAFGYLGLERYLPGWRGILIWIAVVTLYSLLHYLYIERPFYSLAKRAIGVG